MFKICKYNRSKYNNCNTNATTHSPLDKQKYVLLHFSNLSHSKYLGIPALQNKARKMFDCQLADRNVVPLFS